jgi:hypothetical protein
MMHDVRTMEQETTVILEPLEGEEDTMTTGKNTTRVLEDIRIHVKLKLAALWTSTMFLIIYLDYFHLYMPGSIEDLLSGKAFVFDITQAFLLAGLAVVTIPALMIFLSVALPAKANRWTNIIVAVVNIPLLLFNLVGVAWLHMIFGAVVEVVLLLLIIRYAWKWPRLERG